MTTKRNTFDTVNEIDEDIIDLGKIFKQLWKKAWLVMVVAIIVGALRFFYAYFMITPIYQSTAMIYVNNKYDPNEHYFSTGEIYAAQSLVETYMVILKQDPTLQAVIDKYNLPYTCEQLKGMVSAEAQEETEIFSITVTATDPQEAANIVNGIADVLPEQISAVVDGASVRVVSYGRVNANPIAPNYFKYLVTGMFAGFVLAVIGVLAKYFLDKTIHDEDFVNELPISAPVLANIPELYEKRKGKKTLLNENEILCENLKFNGSEAYKLLRTNLLYTLTETKDCFVIGITSSIVGEGKSTTAINLAYTFAETGKRILLIEADMRKPTVASKLNLKAKPGLANILAGFSSIKEALQATSNRSNLHVITSGDFPPNPAELVGSNQMGKMLENLSLHFDYIIVDLPPVNAVSDPLAISPYLDGIVVIVREEYTKITDLKDAVLKLNFAQVNFLGFVLNQSITSNKNQYYYSKKGYGKA